MPHQTQAVNPFAGLVPGGANQGGLASLLGQNFPLSAAPQGLAASPAAQVPAIQQLFNLLAGAQGGVPLQAQVPGQLPPQLTPQLPPQAQVPGQLPLQLPGQLPGQLPAAVQTPLALPGAQAAGAQAPRAAPGIASQQPRLAPTLPPAVRAPQPLQPRSRSQAPAQAVTPPTRGPFGR